MVYPEDWGEQLRVEVRWVLEEVGVEVPVARGSGGRPLLSEMRHRRRWKSRLVRPEDP